MAFGGDFPGLAVNEEDFLLIRITRGIEIEEIFTREDRF
jgi:hypothetical protein